MLLSEKPQYRNDRVDVSDPYQDPSSGHDHFDTVVSPTATSITNHHRNLATEDNYDLIYFLFEDFIFMLHFDK